MDAPLRNFEEASRATLAFLQGRLGFALWMVTRTEGQDWIVLQCADRGYGVEAGTVFSWNDSFCEQMVQSKGPRIAPDSKMFPAYRDAAINREVQINAYVGVPLTRADGSLFGTLCAVDPQRQPAEIANEQNLIELLAAMLSALLESELTAADEIRRSERLALQAATDELTGLSNRRAWNELLAREDERCRRYGHAAAVLVVDLDGLKGVNDSVGHSAGDAVLVRLAQALKGGARSHDLVARLGGDEFGILAAECDRTGAEALLGRIQTAVVEAGLQASIGLAMRSPDNGLQGAWERADSAMYQHKRSRQAALKTAQELLK